MHVFVVKYASSNIASSVHCGTGIVTAPLRIINACNHYKS